MKNDFCRKLLEAAVLAALLAVIPSTAHAQTGDQYYAVTPCRFFDTRFANPYQLAPLKTTPTPLVGRFPPVTETWWPGPYDPLQPVGVLVRLAPAYDGSGNCGVPTNATAISVNASMISSTALGVLLMYPVGAAFPTVATMVVGQGDLVVSNGAIVPLGTYSAGGPDFYVHYTKASAACTSHLALDVTGYFAP